ncbi:hypothetical protein BJY04DRAFT_219412 [Aspergillus karnatakaensis]|uniref:S8 family peptidase n=1 Tax=Aspergillus karnatakaensis TaxID=1810916 RepID=UPI003CCDFB2D
MSYPTHLQAQERTSAKRDDDELDFEDDEEEEVQVLAVPRSTDPVRDDLKKLIKEMRSLYSQESERGKKRNEIAITLKKSLVDQTKPWSGSLEKVTSEKETVLHLLAQQQHTEERWLPCLTAIIISLYPRWKYCIHRGLKVVVKNLQVDRIKKPLREECQEGRDTFLHEAMSSQSLTTAHKELLIDIAPKDAFCSSDSNGLTPLHQAVAYENCSDDQDRVVEQLLAKAPDAMDLRTRRHQSVYDYHEETRRTASRLAARTAGQTRTEHGERGLPSTSGHGPTVTTQDFPQDVPERVLKQGSFTIPSPERRPSIHIHANTKEQRIMSPVPGNRLQRVPTLHANTTGANKETNDKNREDSAERIRQCLKLWYLRNKTPIEVLRQLNRVDAKNGNFWFDFGPCPPNGCSLTSGEFRKNFADIALEPVLKYVAFPEVSVKIEMVSKEDQQLRENKSIVGRKDMMFFFDWLRKAEVKQILNVCVDDSRQPHSDEAIEYALTGFQVEVLDWKKIDWCPECIFRVGDSVHTLRLQWSGNNAALRAWSEPEGLARLPKLRNLVIHQREETDATKRAQDNKNKFGARFDKSWLMAWKCKCFAPHSRLDECPTRGHPPTCIDWVSEYTPGTAEVTPEGPVSPVTQEIYTDSWIKCLETFKRRVPLFRPRQLASNLKDKGLGEPIVVAVIDDGIDKTHPDLSSYQYSGSNFHLYDDNQKVWPYWNSTAGHGTLMARLIHRIAPNVRLHICRLHTRVSENGASVQIVPRSAIEAIHDAVDRGVRIISISWTIPRPEDESERDDFRKAIDRALKKKIHIFCSVSDRGQRAEETFPLNCGLSGMFRIGAAKASGQIWEYVGEAAKLDFACPGHEVLTKEPAEANGNIKFKAHTGSSVATALASGLAASILECVRLGCLYDLENENREDEFRLGLRDWEAIQTREGMADAFKSIETRVGTDGSS